MSNMVAIIVGVIIYVTVWIIAMIAAPSYAHIGNAFGLILVNPIGIGLLVSLGALNGYLFRKSILSADKGDRLAFSMISNLLFLMFLGFIIVFWVENN